MECLWCGKESEGKFCGQTHRKKYGRKKNGTRPAYRQRKRLRDEIERCAEQGKHPYESYEIAMREARKIARRGGPAMRAYLCICGAHHLTRRAQGEDAPARVYSLGPRMEGNRDRIPDRSAAPGQTA